MFKKEQMQSKYQGINYPTTIKEKILQIIYLNLRCISWADGIQNDLVEQCLNTTISEWMKIFVQIINNQ